ncbi:MAG: hypothetical protein LBH59_00440 [Planctomycetaceae bacterium]|nr:hypothetical protein [Planctomycetaceae bacterium]
MKRLLTLVFVAAMVFVCNAVYADDAAVTTEAPIVVGPHGYGGFGHHGFPYGDQFAGNYGMPGQKVGILAKIGNRIKSAKAAREAKRAARGFDGGFAPRRKLFAPKSNAGFGGGFHNGYQEFPAEFQVGGYY